MIVFAAAVMLFANASTTMAQRGPERLDWTGRVDDRVEITIVGRDATQQTIRGTTYSDGRSIFRGTIRNQRRAHVELVQGRGDARVRQHPSRGNGWTTIIRIDDPRASSARYHIRVRWT
jgi:hypothetical protein